jgi:hypothetical protein
VLTARALFDLFPAWMIDDGQQQQAHRCIFRNRTGA